MHFDRLDDIYVMVKSNCQFDKVVLTGLTGLDDMYDRSAQIVQQTLTVPILVVNNGLSHGICHLSLASPFIFIFISSISLRIFPTVMHVLSFLHICFMIFTLTRSPFVWSNKLQDMAVCSCVAECPFLAATRLHSLISDHDVCWYHHGPVVG